MAKSKFAEWFSGSFLRGVTFFHVAGLVLMLFGHQWGEKGKFDGVGFHFSLTLTEVAGAVSFFKELVSAFFKCKETPQADAKGGQG